MKKIIKPGNVGRAGCGNCRCEFTFEREDVIFGNQFDGVNTVECPCCGKAIVIDYTIIPKNGDKK